MSFVKFDNGGFAQVSVVGAENSYDLDRIIREGWSVIGLFAGKDGGVQYAVGRTEPSAIEQANRRAEAEAVSAREARAKLVQAQEETKAVQRMLDAARAEAADLTQALSASKLAASVARLAAIAPANEAETGPGEEG